VSAYERGRRLRWLTTLARLLGRMERQVQIALGTRGVMAAGSGARPAPARRSCLRGADSGPSQAWHAQVLQTYDLPPGAECRLPRTFDRIQGGGVPAGCAIVGRLGVCPRL